MPKTPKTPTYRLSPNDHHALFDIEERLWAVQQHLGMSITASDGTTPWNSSTAVREQTEGEAAAAFEVMHCIEALGHVMGEHADEAEEIAEARRIKIAEQAELDRTWRRTGRPGTTAVPTAATPATPATRPPSGSGWTSGPPRPPQRAEGPSRRRTRRDAGR